MKDKTWEEFVKEIKENKKGEKDRKFFGELNVAGRVVVITRCEFSVNTSIAPWFCSYVHLPNSKEVLDERLSWPTFRKGSIVGFDTAHSYNDTMTEAQKLLDALSQAESAIKQYNEIFGVD